MPVGSYLATSYGILSLVVVYPTSVLHVLFREALTTIPLEGLLYALSKQLLQNLRLTNNK